jgi:uncharacterized membrane protein YbhN (UPF0104 family)
MGKRALLVLVGIAVGAACLWFALSNVDFNEIAHSLAGASKTSIPFFLASLFAFYWIKAVRWRALLSPIKVIPTRELFPPLMVGYGISMLVPLHLGEVARVIIARSEQSVRASALVMSIALERMLDLLTIPLLFAVAALTRDDLPVVLVSAAYFMGTVGLLGVAVAAVFVVRPGWFINVVTRLPRLPPAWRDRLLEQVRAAAEGAAVLRAPRQMAWIASLTLLQWALMWLCAWISIRAVGITTTWSAALLTVAMINVAVALPTSPGFIGSVQAAFVLALLPFSVDKATAIAASIYFHLLIYVAVVSTGLLFLHRAGRSLRSLFQASRAPG